MNAPHATNGERPVRQTLLAVATFLLSAAVGWLFKVTFDNTQAIAEIRVAADKDATRIEHLETGRTTPMAVQTRMRFDDMQRQLDELKTRTGYPAR